MEASLIDNEVLDESMGDAPSLGNTPSKSGRVMKRFYPLKTQVLSLLIIFVTVRTKCLKYFLTSYLDFFIV